MSIKSDRWIRRMAEQHGMIEPFEPGQVREANGEKIVSYGTSSYGYDIRCAPEFKVFTNIHSTVVDPKNFDEKSFVDIDAPVCIIPPNSFALARTMEYFRIPRNVLTICLGKSTYARCGIIVNVTPFHTMLAAYYVGREGQTKQGLSLSPQQLWWQHTAGAAKALGLAGVVGNLQPGCEADFVVLNPEATPLLARKTQQARNLEELLFALIVLGDDRVVEQTVISQGQLGG